MAKVTVLGMLCTGHDGFPPRPSIEGSDFVTIDGIPVVTVDHKWDIHCNDTCHPGTSKEGSSFVTIDGKAVMRKDDLIDCGSFVDETVDWVDIDK
jgi:uncharacterized Zn-binding protein involved in type VI secretion